MKFLSRLKTNLHPIPIILFVLGLATLLIGQRFDATWAGGDGMRSEFVVSVIAMSHQNSDHQLDRGEIVQTGDDEYLIIDLGGHAHIGLAERTDLELDRLFDDELEITVTRGRVVVELLNPDTTIRINTNETETHLLEGRISLINYDFLEKITISPWDTASGTVTTNASAYTLDEPLSIHETSAVTTATSFEPADPFYDWYTQ